MKMLHRDLQFHLPLVGSRFTTKFVKVRILINRQLWLTQQKYSKVLHSNRIKKITLDNLPKQMIFIVNREKKEQYLYRSHAALHARTF